MPSPLTPTDSVIVASALVACVSVIARVAVPSVTSELRLLADAPGSNDTFTALVAAFCTSCASSPEPGVVPFDQFDESLQFPLPPM